MTSNKHTIFKNGSTTYYYSSLFFPPKIREEVSTLYAFVRTADDFVDQVPPQKKEFNEFVKNTWKSWEGQTTPETVITEFVALAKAKKFKKKWVEAFLEAMSQDLKVKNYITFTQLQRYMYGSAEVIGLMMAQIMNLPPQARRAAQLQGRAMQFINFIRDIQEDKNLGRIYLPQKDREKVGLKLDEWNEEKWSTLIKQQIKKYYRLQAQAEKGYKYIPFWYRIPIKTAAYIYTWTAQQIEKDPTIVWRQKVKPSRFRIISTFSKQFLLG